MTRTAWLPPLVWRLCTDFARESMRYIQKLKNYYDPIIQVLDLMHEQI
jgi:hypothetical protein